MLRFEGDFMRKIITNEKVLETNKIHFGMYNDVINKKVLTESGIEAIPYSIIRFGILYEVLDEVYIDIITEKIVEKNKIDITRFNKFNELVSRVLEEITVESIIKITDVLFGEDYVEDIIRENDINFELKSLDSDNMYTRFLDNLENNLNRKLK